MIPLDDPDARDPAALTEPRLRRVYAYWLERKGARRFPARGDIDPADFTYALGHVMMVAGEREPLRFQVRLHGSEMARRSGYDLTGKWLDDIPISEAREAALAVCRDLVATGEVRAFQRRRILDGRLRRFEVLWLPFSENGTDVSLLLCAL